MIGGAGCEQQNQAHAVDHTGESGGAAGSERDEQDSGGYGKHGGDDVRDTAQRWLDTTCAGRGGRFCERNLSGNGANMRHGSTLEAPGATVFSLVLPTGDTEPSEGGDLLLV